MAEFSHCQKFSSCVIRISPGLACAHYPSSFPCDSLQKMSLSLLFRQPLNIGKLWMSLLSLLFCRLTNSLISAFLLMACHSLLWTTSSLSTSFLYRGDQKAQPFLIGQTQNPAICVLV